MIRLLLADDHAIIRDGVRRVLDTHTDLEVVGEAEDGASLLAMLDAGEPDVLVLDLSLPDIGGVELVRRLREERPHLPILVLTMYPEDQLALHLFELGVRAYLSKSRSSDELVSAIRAVHAGGEYVTATLERLRGAVKDRADVQPHQRLSTREYQVFLLLIQGKTVSEISHTLELNISTVSNHVAGIREKLGCASLGEILRYAHRAGLLS
jgi:DNA-binding NarL/FixJ family response regulator